MGKPRVFRHDTDFSELNNLETYIKHFSENGEHSLNYQNFKDLLSNLFTNSQGKSYDIPEYLQKELFDTFDKNEDGIINVDEFRYLCNYFIKPLVQPVCALLIIDVQNDFIEGSLALKKCPAKQDGNDVIPVINKLLENHKFDLTVYSCDYHPENHISFFENVNLYQLSEKNNPMNEISLFDTVTFKGPPEMDQKLWPAHCVQNTWGSELHEDLIVLEDSVCVYKGTDSKIDSYSAFFDNMRKSKTILQDELLKRNISHVFVCGLALDYCVTYTAADALDLGYATVILTDASRGTDVTNIKEAEERLKSLNCVLTQSTEIEGLLKGKDIRVEFASAILKALKFNIK